VLDKCARVATSVATQALRLGGTERHWMEWGPYLSSRNGSGQVRLEGFGPTRNRKVVGSDLGLHITPAQRPYLSLAAPESLPSPQRDDEQCGHW
jgi:hypothetical protein